MRQHTIAMNMPLGDALMATPAISELIRRADPAADRFTIALCWPGGPPWPQHWDAFNHFPGAEVRQVDGGAAERLLGLPPGKWCFDDAGNGEILLSIGAAFDVARTLICPYAWGFAAQLGVPLKSTRYTWGWSAEERASFRAMDAEFGRDVLIAPVANSCPSRSKPEPTGGMHIMIPWECWAEVARRVSAEDRMVRVAAYGEPVHPAFDALVAGGKVQWLATKPLRLIAGFARACRAVLAVDTGIGHVAQAVGAKAIVSVEGGVPSIFTTLHDTPGRYRRVPRIGPARDNVDPARMADAIWGNYLQVTA